MMTIKYPSPVPTQKAYWTPNSVWHSIDFFVVHPISTTNFQALHRQLAQIRWSSGT